VSERIREPRAAAACLGGAPAPTRCAHCSRRNVTGAVGPAASSVREPGWAPSRPPPGRLGRPFRLLYLDRCLRATKLAPYRDVPPNEGHAASVEWDTSREGADGIDRSVWRWRAAALFPTCSPARRPYSARASSMIDPSAPRGKRSCHTDHERRGSLHVSCGDGRLEPESPPRSSSVAVARCGARVSRVKPSASLAVADTDPVRALLAKERRRGSREWAGADGREARSCPRARH
jgi:hypothetical protein